MLVLPDIPRRGYKERRIKNERTIESMVVLKIIP